MKLVGKEASFLFTAYLPQCKAPIRWKVPTHSFEVTPEVLFFLIRAHIPPARAPLAGCLSQLTVHFDFGGGFSPCILHSPHLSERQLYLDLFSGRTSLLSPQATRGALSFKPVRNAPVHPPAPMEGCLPTRTSPHKLLSQDSGGGSWIKYLVFSFFGTSSPAKNNEWGSFTWSRLSDRNKNNFILTLNYIIQHKTTKYIQKSTFTFHFASDGSFPSKQTSPKLHY